MDAPSEVWTAVDQLRANVARWHVRRWWALAFSCALLLMSIWQWSLLMQAADAVDAIGTSLGRLGDPEGKVASATAMLAITLSGRAAFSVVTAVLSLYHLVATVTHWRGRPEQQLLLFLFERDSGNFPLGGRDV